MVIVRFHLSLKPSYIIIKLYKYFKHKKADNSPLTTMLTPIKTSSTELCTLEQNRNKLHDIVKFSREFIDVCTVHCKITVWIAIQYIHTIDRMCESIQVRAGVV